MKRVIVFDRDGQLRNRIRVALGNEVDATECSSLDGCSSLLQAGAELVVLGTSSASSGPRPSEILQRLHALDPSLPVLVLVESKEQALEALSNGAYYALEVPIDIDELSLIIARALRSRQPFMAGNDVDDPDVAPWHKAGLAKLKETVLRLPKKSLSPLFIAGERGSGKATIARALHRESGRSGPFVRVNTSSTTLLEEALFGGAPSALLPQGRPGLVEQAAGGTLYIDEVVDLPAPVQTKLVRLVQDGTFRRPGSALERHADVRIMAGSSRDPFGAVRAGRLAPQLLYRLAVITFEVPPLRDRLEDLPALVHEMLSLRAQASDLSPTEVSPAVLSLFERHNWPGNVRELRNVVNGAAARASADVVEPHHLPSEFDDSRRATIAYHLPADGIDFEALEHEVLTQALRLTRGNQTRAAELLHMTRDQVRYRMSKFGLSSRPVFVELDRSAS
jgi:two-component system response regulator AtoC